MRVRLAFMGVLVSCVASGAGGADYVAFGAEAEEAAHVLTSLQSCKRLGFHVDDRPEAASEISDITIRRGIALGIDRAMAETMMLDALKREQIDLAFISQPPEQADTVQELVASMRENIAFWDDRCQSLISGELGSRYIRRTGTEADVQARLLAAATEQIEAAASGE